MTIVVSSISARPRRQLIRVEPLRRWRSEPARFAPGNPGESFHNRTLSAARLACPNRAGLVVGCQGHQEPGCPHLGEEGC
jgi:hypothetical protein